MFSYIYEYLWPQEIQIDQKQLRQKYLVLLQIKNHKIRLKPISSAGSTRSAGYTQKVKIIPPHKRPLWKKMPVIL
jgi:hypothetical protein